MLVSELRIGSYYKVNEFRDVGNREIVTARNSGNDFYSNLSEYKTDVLIKDIVKIKNDIFIFARIIGGPHDGMFIEFFEKDGYIDLLIFYNYNEKVTLGYPSDYAMNSQKFDKNKIDITLHVELI